MEGVDLHASTDALVRTVAVATERMFIRPGGADDPCDDDLTPDVTGLHVRAQLDGRASQQQTYTQRFGNAGGHDIKTASVRVNSA